MTMIFLPTWSSDFHALPWSSVLWKDGAESPTFTGLSSATAQLPVHRANARVKVVNVFMQYLRRLWGDQAGLQGVSSSASGMMIGEPGDLSRSKRLRALSEGDVSHRADLDRCLVVEHRLLIIQNRVRR